MCLDSEEYGVIVLGGCCPDGSYGAEVKHGECGGDAYGWVDLCPSR